MKSFCPGNTYLLFKNFLVFFKKNSLQLFALVFLTAVMVMIGFGTLVSNYDIQYQTKLLNIHTHWSSFNDIPSFRDKNEDDNYNAYQKIMNNNKFNQENFSEAFSNYYVQNDGYSFEDPQNLSQTPLTNATFQLWDLNQNADLNSEGHTYALVVNNPGLNADNLGLWHNSQLLNNTIHLNLGPGLENANVILFKDIFHFFTDSKLNFTPYFSQANHHQKLYLAQYGANYFADFNSPAYRNVIIDGTTCGTGGASAHCNQTEVYQQYVMNHIPFLQQFTTPIDTRVNNYVNHIEQVLLDATIGGVYSGKFLEEYATSFDIQHEKKIIYLQANDGSIPELLVTGYKQDAYSLYHLQPGEVLISHAYALTQGIHVGDQISLYGMEGKFKVIGYSVSKIVTNLLSGVSINNDGYGVWMNPQDYQTGIKTLVKLPQSTLNYQYVGDVFDYNTINPNFTENVATNIVNSVKNVSAAITLTSDPKTDKELGSNYNGAIIRLGIINSLILVFTILLFISSLILAIIIVKKVIEQNITVLGVLKANGLSTFKMTAAFLYVFIVIFLLASLIGIGAGYGFGHMLNTTYEFGVDLFNYNVQFHLWPTIIVVLGIPSVMALIVWGYTYHITQINALSLMQQVKYRVVRQSVVNWKWYQHVGFSVKVTWKFIGEAKLKICLTLFIAIIGGAVFYSTFVATELFTQSATIINDLQFKYYYGFEQNLSVGPGNIQLSTLKQFLLNEDLFVDKAKLTTAFPENYQEITVVYHNGIPYLDDGELTNIEQTGFRNYWIYAKNLTAIHNYCAVNKECYKDSFSGHIISYLFLTNAYKNNDYYVSLLNQHNGIMSFGFQTYDQNDDSLGLSENVWAKPLPNGTNITQLLSNPYSLTTPTAIIPTVGIDNYQETAKGPIVRTLSHDTQPLQLLNAQNNRQVEYEVSAVQRSKLRNVELGVMNYNQLHPDDTYNLTFVPLYINNLRGSSKQLNVNDLLWDSYGMLASPEDYQHHKYAHQAFLFVVADWIRSFNHRINYANYNMLNRYYLASRGYDSTYYVDDQKSAPLKIINYDYSSENINYAQKYLGLYAENNNYSPTNLYQASNNKIENYLVFLMNRHSIEVAINSIISILFLILLVISIFLIVTNFLQINVTTSMIMKDNLNVINLFRAVGYTDWWIIKHLFLVYLPVIVVSALIAFPIGVAISNFMFEIFTRATDILYGIGIAWWGLIGEAAILLLLFVVGFICTWIFIKRNYKVYQIIK